jgi:MFS family permease
MLLTSVSPAAAYAPLRHAAFRMLWVATLASNTGLWIQNTGAGWLMTSLAPSPVMVSLVQAASMLPVFLFALPGGVLADLLDRRLTLIAAQIWVVVAGLLLAGLAMMGWLGAWGLLALTFLIGAGTAVIFPAWAAAIPELVPRNDLVQAVALNGVGFNLARAFGPALGGVAMAAAGPGATFSLDALGFVALLWALLVWHRPAAPHSDLPSERIPSAMRAALRFAIGMPILRAAILRAWAFFEVPPDWWTPTMLLHEVGLLWPRPLPPMRRSFGAKWSSWCVPGVIRPIWLANSNPRPRRSAIEWPRPIGRTAAERQSPLLMPA